MFFQFGYSPDLFLVRRAHWRATFVLAMGVSVLAPAGSAHAQEVPLTLAEAERLALDAEPGQRALEDRAAAFTEHAVVAGALPDPEVRIGLNNYPIESGGFTTEGMTNAAVVYRQSFPAGDTRTISATQLEWRAIEMTRSADSRGRNVLTATRSAWLESYFWDRAHELVTESRPFFDDLATVTRSQYSVGRRDQQDVLRAELELSRIDDRLIDIERQRAKAEAALAEWIGDDASRPIALKFPEWPSLPPLGDLQASLTTHPSVLASDARIAARDAGVDLADERSKPEWALDIAYSYRNGSLPNGGPRSDFVTVGVTVGLPFLRRKTVDSTLAAALKERSSAKLSRERLLRELRSQLEAEYARFRDLSRRLSLYETRILQQAENTAQASMLAYQSDRGDFADVMRGYITDLNTRIEYIRLQVERAESYAVLANLGGLFQ